MQLISSPHKSFLATKQSRRQHWCRGFTLIELLVVIAIIGLLATSVIAAVNSARQKARIAKAEATLKEIHSAVSFLEGDTLEWPGHQPIGEIDGGGANNEVWDLTASEAGIIATDGLFPGWNGPYMSTIALDPWGNLYFFDTDYDIDPGAGTTWAVVIGSFGPNGEGQNLYDEDNIIRVIATE